MWGSERSRKCLGPNILPFHFLRGHINIHLIFGVIYIYQEFSPRDFWMDSTKTERSCSQTTWIPELILVNFSWRPQSHIFPNITELKSSIGFHSAWSWWSRMGTGDTRSLWLLITWSSWSSVPSYCGINTLFSDLSFLSKQGFLFPVHFLSSIWAGPGRHLWFCFTSPDGHPVRSTFQTGFSHYASLGQCGIESCPRWYNDLLTSSSPFTSSQRGLLKNWWLFESPSQKLLGYPQMSSEQSASSEQMDRVLPYSLQRSVSP